jgi:predicted transcriptional regulator
MTKKKTRGEIIEMILNAASSNNRHISYPKKMTKDTKRQLIREFINRNPGSTTSEIIERLNIDPITTVQMLQELKQNDLIFSKPLE